MTGHVLRPGYSRRDTLLANPFEGVDLDAFPEGAKSAVLHRDNHECQACGFASDRFCEIVAAVDPAFLAEDYVTLCRACWLFENLDRAAMLNAAAFIWAPELSQLEINRAAPILYTERLSKTSKARPAIENLLKTLKERRQRANREFGVGPEDDMLKILSRDGGSIRPVDDVIEKLSGDVRLWPLDRWIERAGQYEYNTYHSMLAYWRRMIPTSEPGNYGANAITQDWLARLG